MKLKILKSIAGASFSFGEGQIVDAGNLVDGVTDEWIASGLAVEHDGLSEDDLRQRIADLEARMAARPAKTASKA